MSDELTAEMMCPHGERCCQGEPCNGPQTTCWHCKSEVPAVDSCPVCDGDGSVLDLDYVHGLARLAAERGERIRGLEKGLRDCQGSLERAIDASPDGGWMARALDAERALAAERAKVATLEQRCGEQKVQLDYAYAGQIADAEEIAELRATLAKVEAERDAWKESASMACERAADDCTCAGCRYAAEVHAPKGTTGT